MTFVIIDALRSIFRKPPEAITGDDIAAFREVISIIPDDDFYPTRDAVALRLEQTGAFRPDCIDWIAGAICEGSCAGSGYSSVEIRVREQGRPLSSEEKKALGLRSNYKVGRRFVDACTIEVREAARHVFLATQAACSEAIRGHNRRRWKESGVTHVRVIPCNDDRDCDAVRMRRGERIGVDAAKLPLPGCDAEYCRCILQAEVRFDSPEI